MRMKIRRILPFCCLLLLLPAPLSCEAFVTKSPSIASSSVVVRQRRGDGAAAPSFLSSSGGGDDAPAPRKGRRRRRAKQAPEEAGIDADAGGGGDNEDAVVDESMDLKPRATAPTKLEVRDVRGVVGVDDPSVRATAAGPAGSPAGPPPPAIDGGRRRTETAPDDPTAAAAYGGGGAPDDSFAQILEDARRMKAEGDGGGEEDGEKSVKAKARDILSTIVTADFFVVCGFLLWFLAGIGVRAVFDNDSVQIAFNNNFELLVQPSLGVLMLGTIAGNYLKDEDEGA